MLLAITAGEGGRGTADAFWRREIWLLRAGVRATALRVLAAMTSGSESSSPSESSTLLKF